MQVPEAEAKPSLTLTVIKLDPLPVVDQTTVGPELLCSDPVVLEEDQV